MTRRAAAPSIERAVPAAKGTGFALDAVEQTIEDATAGGQADHDFPRSRPGRSDWRCRYPAGGDEALIRKLGLEGQ